MSAAARGLYRRCRGKRPLVRQYVSDVEHPAPVATPPAPQPQPGPVPA